MPGAPVKQQQLVPRPPSGGLPEMKPFGPGLPGWPGGPVKPDEPVEQTQPGGPAYNEKTLDK